MIATPDMSSVAAVVSTYMQSTTLVNPGWSLRELLMFHNDKTSILQRIHVARMGHERLPRRFLTSWVRNPRPHGRPQFTYGHSLNKTLKWAGISTDFAVWSELAEDRPA